MGPEMLLPNGGTAVTEQAPYNNSNVDAAGAKGRTWIIYSRAHSEFHRDVVSELKSSELP